MISLLEEIGTMIGNVIGSLLGLALGIGFWVVVIHFLIKWW